MGRRVIIGMVVMVVLAQVAQGGFQIGTRYLDDTPFDPDIDVLGLDESLYLSCYTDETVSGHMGGYYWALVCEASLATITGGEPGADATEGSIFLFYGSASGFSENEDGQWGAIGNDDPSPGVFLEPGVWLDNFLYSPMAVGDVTVRFLEISSGSFTIVSVPDLIVIHQVPEPMTIILVGLGGLFLVRRSFSK